MWEQRNDWMRSWECRKRKMYNKNRPLVNQKRNICFNGTGINHQKRPYQVMDCDIQYMYILFWWWWNKSVFSCLQSLYTCVYMNIACQGEKNFWFLNVVVTAFSVYTMETTGIYCCESVSLFWLNTPLQSLNVTRNCFVFMTEIKWEVVSVALHTIWYSVMVFFCRCCC